MKRLVLILLFVSSLTFATATQAQTATPTQQTYDWCRYIDFTTGQHGWSTFTHFSRNAGSYSAGVGWLPTDTDLGGYKTRQTQLHYTYTGNAFITNFTLFYDYTFGHGEDTQFVTQFLQMEQSSNAADWFTLDRSEMVAQGFDGTNKSYHRQHPSSVWTVQNGIRIVLASSVDNLVPTTYSGSLVIRGLEFRGTSTNPFGTSNCGSFGGTATPSPTSTPAPTEYYRPLLSSDITWDLTQNPNDNPSTIAFSYEAGKPVHAAFDSVVTDIQFARVGDCDELLGETTSFIFNRSCSLIDPEEGNHSFDIQGAWFSANDSTYLRDVSIVTLYSSDEGLTLHYLLDEPELYVSIGDEITGGCVLGNTSPLENESIGVTTLSAFIGGTATDITEFLTEEPSGSAPACGVPGGEDFDISQCLNTDPTLTDIGQWVTTDPLEWINPGVIVHSQFGNPYGSYTHNGKIEQLLNLDPAREPEVIISARAIGLDGKFQVQLGDEITQFDLSPYADYHQVVTAPAGAADVSGFYSLRIEPNGQGSISINYICVRHALDEELDPVDPPLTGDAVCTLANYSFSTIDSAWDVTGTYHWTLGEIRLDDDGTIDQSLTLAAGDYTIRAAIGLYKTLGYDFDTSGTVSLAYTYDSLSDTIGTTPAYSAFQIINEIEVSDTFTIASDTTDTIEFTVNVSNPDSEVLGVVLRSICIQPASEGGEPVFQEQCEAISSPSGNGFGDWIQWLKAHLYKFYYCDLMRLLNLILSLLRTFFNTFAWSMRYWMAFADLFVQWLDYDFIGWLGGHMRNIQPATVTQQAGCSSVWCLGEALINGLTTVLTRAFDSIDLLIREILSPLLDFLLWLLTSAAQLLFAVIMALVSLIFLFMGQLVELFILAKDLLFALILAWNESTPTALPGMWDCETFTDIHSFCWVLWMIENTIFSGTAGSAIIPVFVALGYILLAIYAIKRIQKLIREAGEAL